MTVSMGMRTRVIALCALLATLLLGAGTMMLSRGGSGEAAVDVPTPAQTSRPAVTKPKPAVNDDSAPALPTAAKPAPALPDTGLPKALAQALARHDVVVVSLVSGGSVLDQLAAAEAGAGAKRAGVGFVKIEVADRLDLKRLTAELRVRHTPSVLVFTRPDRLFVQVTGFADRETVAQAAVNAS